MLRRTPLLIVASLLIARGASGQARHGLDPTNMDTTCQPCQDFNRYANGGWLARTQLDAQHASYGSFTELSERNQETLRRIVEKLAAAAPGRPKTNDDKIGAFYASCMDTAAAEAAGPKPLGPELARIAAIKTTADLVSEIARVHQGGRGGLFGFSGGPDFKNSNLTIVNVSQGGLGLPDREYYLRPDSATAVVRAAYLLHVSRSLQLLGDA